MDERRGQTMKELNPSINYLCQKPFHQSIAYSCIHFKVFRRLALTRSA